MIWPVAPVLSVFFNYLIQFESDFPLDAKTSTTQEHLVILSFQKTLMSDDDKPDYKSAYTINVLCPVPG